MGKIIKYYLKYWPLILLCFAFLFGQALLDLTLPDYMSKIVIEGVQGKQTSQIWYYGGIMIGLALGVTAFSVVVGYLAAKIGAGVSRDLRSAVFSKVSDFSGAEFDKLSVSTLITRSTNDISQLQMFTIMFTRIALYAPIMAVGGVLKAVEKSSGINSMVWAIVIAVVILIVAIAILLIIVYPKFSKLQKLTDKINLLAREGLNGMMVVRAFNTSAHETKRFDASNRELTDMSLFVNRIMSLLMPVINLVMYGLMVAVVWITSNNAADPAAVANLMAFIQYAMQIVMAFMLLVMTFIMMPRAIVSAARIGEVISTEITIRDKDDAFDIGSAKGDVEFKNVNFAYPGSDENVLTDICFAAKAGETTAIIGSTGCGKSTLISLIPRMYDAISGEILIDGKNVKDIKLESLRENIAYVPQKNVLFSGTIESNIKYSRETATLEEVKKAAEIAQATDFIESKDEGYDFEIAQGGANVSGGQKQRLAIARALIKDSPILIFDDSFSALDFKTDSNLREAINTNIKDAAKIIVAQRVGTIMSADKILVLDDGKIVGQGTHKELLKSCEVYKDIAFSQLTEEDLKK